MRTFKVSVTAFVYLALFGASILRGADTHLPTGPTTIPIGGPGGWDCLSVDTVMHRLYVSHGTHVPIIDLDQNKVVGDIPGTPRVHAIAIAPEFGRGFISDGGDTTVTVFDLKTDSVIARVTVTGRNPDLILYDPSSHRVFTFNGGGMNATVIDAQSLKVLGTIPLDGKPEFAVSDYSGRVFVNIEDKSLVAVIDPVAMKVTATWPIAPAEEPSALVIDRAHHRLFTCAQNKLMAVLDTDSGRVITTVPIGTGVDGAAFDPATQMVFSSNGEGTLTVIHEDDPNTFSVLSTLETARGARTMALDERTHRLYLPVGTRPDSTGVAKDDFRVLVYQE
jgi:DNA-binding beta-propeller fold protein YncE